MANKWGDRIRRLKRHYFVGRGGELNVFRSFLFHSGAQEKLLHLHGPGGIGKSTLLDEFAAIAEEHGIPYPRQPRLFPYGFRLLP